MCEAGTGELSACVACGKTVPRVFAQCAACRLCSGCCFQDVVTQCPSLANGGPLHQHELVYTATRSHPCGVGGWACGSGGGGWRCRLAGADLPCEFEVCAACAARRPPEGFRREGRSRARVADGPVPAQAPEWVALCTQGHLMESDRRPFNTCDMCGTTGTSHRCTQGCDYDMCQDCYGSLVENPDFDTDAAEQSAAWEWSAQGGDEHEEDQDIVVGGGAIQFDVAHRGKGVSRRGVGKGKGKKGKGKGKGKGKTKRRGAAPLLPPPLDRHLSPDSRQALSSFALGAEQAKRAAADVATAEELLAQAAARGLSDEAHGSLRAAIAAGNLSLAGQFLLGATFRTVDEPGPGTQCDICPICAEDMSGASALGGVVGCVNGHALHAGCAADLALGGGVCPTCRAPLFYAATAMNTYDVVSSRHKSHPHPVFRVTDRVLVHSDAAKCSSLQAHPKVGGWHEDMQPSCGAEGEVVEVLEEVSLPDGPVRPVEVRHADGTTWRWHPGLLMLLCGALEEEVVAPGSATASIGRKQVDRLRDELVAVERAREEVRQETVRALSDEDMLHPPGAAAASSDPCLAPPVPALGSRAISTASAQTVGALRSLSVAPVDVQRARHLLALAKQWGCGDSDDSARKARATRASVHAALTSGSVDSAARIVRHFNAQARLCEALWADAARPTSWYRVAPGVRVELLAAPRRGAPRTGFVLHPGVEFESSREVLDAEGCFWVRVGSALAAEAAAAGSDDARAGGLAGPARRRGRPVRQEDVELLARVVRGNDWEWGDQDGGPGNEGTMTALVQGNGWVTVRWDTGGENNYRIGHDGYYDLEYVARDGPPVPAQGWAQVRPAGAGTARAVAPIRGAACCFACGEDLIPPFAARRGGRAGERAGPSRVPFLPVDAQEVAIGDEVLVAATLERVVVERVVPLCCRSRASTDQAAGGAAPAAPAGGRAADAADAPPAVPSPVSTRASTGSGWPAPPAPTPATPAASVASAARGGGGAGRDAPAALVCRFAAAPAPAGGGAAAAEDDDAFVFRAADLVWPSSESQNAGEPCPRDELRSAGGVPRSRRELFLAEGSVAAARRIWGPDQGATANAPAASFATCVRGHFLHARCFQGCLLSGSGCPACQEALFVPGVQREGPIDEEVCCGGSAPASSTGHVADAARAVEEEVRQIAEQRAGAETVRIEGRDLKMCPLCCAGPLLNENCSDMQTHHGQCPQCGSRPHSAATIAEAVARSGTQRVGTLIPVCPSCKVPVLFNGCAECGHLFAGISWDSLPNWDPQAKSELEMNVRYLRTVRLLAAQVRTQAALLAHERAALGETQDAQNSVPRLDFGEAPVRRVRSAS